MYLVVHTKKISMYRFLEEFSTTYLLLVKSKIDVRQFLSNHNNYLPIKIHINMILILVTGVMALVLFFVPEPAVGLAEMKRVVKPGGIVSAYVWDVFEEGLPISEFHNEFRLLDSIVLQYCNSYQAKLCLFF